VADRDSSSFDPTYLSAVDEIYHYGWSAAKLLRVRLLAHSIEHFWPSGHPTRLVHVAGTNGKGGTCRLFEAALAPLGRTGAWLNPHLFDYAERFSIDRRPAERSEIAALWCETVRPHSLERAEGNLDHALSFAEAGLLIALHLFERHEVRWAAMETGVGGRYAPTMALDVELALLTDVGRDHPRTLGRETWQVALEKAGVARKGRGFLSTVGDEAREYVRQTAQAEGAICRCLDRADLVALSAEIDALRETGRIAADFEPGEHWLRNACLALAAARELEPQLPVDRALKAICAEPPLPGRLWRVREHLVADVAHNPDKLAALAADIDREFPGRPLRVVLGISRNRSLPPLLKPLLPRLRSLILTGASYAGRDPLELLRELRESLPGIEAEVERDPDLALERALRERRDTELVLITGSAYTIDQALNPDPYMKRINAEFGRRGGELFTF